MVADMSGKAQFLPQHRDSEMLNRFVQQTHKMPTFSFCKSLGVPPGSKIQSSV